MNTNRLTLLAMLAAVGCHESPKPALVPLTPRHMDVQLGKPAIEHKTEPAPETELAEPLEKYKGCMVYCPAEPPRIDRTMPLNHCAEDSPSCEQDPIWETHDRQ